MFFFGYGYTAAILAKRLKAEGWGMAGTTRTNDKVNAMWEQGVEPHVWDGEAKLEAPMRVLKDVTHILISIPPGKDGDPVLVHHRNLLRKLGKDLEWVGYISSTAVYGDTKDEWCDEDYAPNPTLQRGIVRLAVEKNYRKVANNSEMPLHIFRAGALYGPGRNALARIVQGKAQIMRRPNHWISRIHAEDLAATIFASMMKPNPKTTYNVVDDCPSGMDAPVEFAVKMLGLPQPPVIDVDENAENVPPLFKHSLIESRRVRNDLIKAELGVQLTYPSYKEAYQSFIDRYLAMKARQDEAKKAAADGAAD